MTQDKQGGRRLSGPRSSHQQGACCGCGTLPGHPIPVSPVSPSAFSQGRLLFSRNTPIQNANGINLPGSARVQEQSRPQASSANAAGDAAANTSTGSQQRAARAGGMSCWRSPSAWHQATVTQELLGPLCLFPEQSGAAARGAALLHNPAAPAVAVAPSMPLRPPRRCQQGHWRPPACSLLTTPIGVGHPGFATSSAAHLCQQ